MAANTETIQYRGQGTSAPGPGTSGCAQLQIEGTSFKERVARAIQSASHKIQGAGGSDRKTFL